VHPAHATPPHHAVSPRRLTGARAWCRRQAGKDLRSNVPSTLSRPADASKLKKHITLVADRLHKGLRPVSQPVEGGGAAPAPPSVS